MATSAGRPWTAVEQTVLFFVERLSGVENDEHQ